MIVPLQTPRNKLLHKQKAGRRDGRLSALEEEVEEISDAR